MKWFFNLKIFWHFRIEEYADGYYHVYYNWVTCMEEAVHAGWHRNVLQRESSTWKTVLERLK